MNLRVVSNLDRFESDLASRVDVVSLNGPPMKHGRLRKLARIVRECYRSDIAFIDADPGLTLQFCLARTLLPGSRCQIVCADPMLNKPAGALGRGKAAAKRLLFRKIARFILLQREYSGYQRYYGMDAERVRYVRFKVNQLDRILEMPVTDAGYYLACGVTHRDWDTLAEAWRGLDIPLVISIPEDEELARWGMSTRLPRQEDFGANVRIVRNRSEEWLARLAEARGLIVPINANGINPSGISTYLMAFAMRKPVVITESPSTIGILTEDMARVVPPEDPDALRNATLEIDGDPELRRRMGENGLAYARECGDRRRLNTDYLAIAFELFDEAELTAPPLP